VQGNSQKKRRVIVLSKSHYIVADCFGPPRYDPVPGGASTNKKDNKNAASSVCPCHRDATLRCKGGDTPGSPSTSGALPPTLLQYSQWRHGCLDLLEEKGRERMAGTNPIEINPKEID
jgi:hypothetical protein